MNKLSQLFAAIGAYYALAAEGMQAQQPEHGLPPRPQPQQAEKHTYWQHTGSGMIIDAWKCATSNGQPNICIKVHSVDPASPGMKDMAAELLDKKRVSDQEVFRLCGFNPRFVDLRQERTATDDNLGKWRGKMKVPLDNLRGKGNGEKTPSAEIEQMSDGSLRLRVWAKVPILGTVFNRTLNFTPIENPPPACVSPTAPQVP